MADTQNNPKYLTPKWFGSLFRGELGLGDTFWVGAIGAQLIFAPFWFFLVIFVIILASTAMDGFILVVSAFYAVYYGALLRAVTIVALRCDKAVGGWRWSAIVFTLIFLLTGLGMLYSKLSA